MKTAREETTAPAAPAPADEPPDWLPLGGGVTIWAGAWTPTARELFTPAAVEMLAALHRQLDAERRDLLAARARRQAEWDAGGLPAPLEGAITERAQGNWSGVCASSRRSWSVVLGGQPLMSAAGGTQSGLCATFTRAGLSSRPPKR